MNTALEKLFAMGRVEDTIEIKGVTFTLVPLDTRTMSDALYAAGKSASPEATLLNQQSEILARAIVSINGVKTIANPNLPTQEEIDKNLNEVIAKLHYSVVRAIYEKHDKMDLGIGSEVDKDIKK